jgi:hypothetical protein
VSAQPGLIGAHANGTTGAQPAAAEATRAAAPAAPGGAEPELEFELLGARALRHAAAPAMALDLQVSESSGRTVYMIGLSIQLMIEPARRRYDERTHERLAGLFGAPERWAVTTRSLLWAQLDVVVPAFTGRTTVAVTLPCSYDLELAAVKYLHSLPDGEAPLAAHFNGIVYYRDDAGGLRLVLVPWSHSIDFRMPVSVWRETISHYYPQRGWVALHEQTLEELERARVELGLPTYDDCVRALLETGAGDA